MGGKGGCSGGRGGRGADASSIAEGAAVGPPSGRGSTAESDGGSGTLGWRPAGVSASAGVISSPVSKGACGLVTGGAAEAGVRCPPSLGVPSFSTEGWWGSLTALTRAGEDGASRTRLGGGGESPLRAVAVLVSSSIETSPAGRGGGGGSSVVDVLRASEGA